MSEEKGSTYKRSKKMALSFLLLFSFFFFRSPTLVALLVPKGASGGLFSPPSEFPLFSLPPFFLPLLLGPTTVHLPSAPFPSHVLFSPHAPLSPLRSVKAEGGRSVRRR